jgi:hypothetical protein
MKTYWDYTDQERSLLTEDDVRLLLDVELMKEGVKKPVAPVLNEVPKSPLGQRTRFFGVECKGKYGSDESLSIAFRTAEEAQAFIELNAIKSDYDYECGSEFRYALPLNDAKIVSEELYTLDQINQFRSLLKQRKALAEENARLTSEYTKQSGLAEKITDGVWKNWYAAKSRREELQGIVKTYNQYLTLTKEDVGMALSFLAKVHTQDDISETREWFPDQIPTEAPPQAAESQYAAV